MALDFHWLSSNGAYSEITRLFMANAVIRCSRQTNSRQTSRFQVCVYPTNWQCLVG